MWLLEMAIDQCDRSQNDGKSAYGDSHTIWDVTEPASPEVQDVLKSAPAPVTGARKFSYEGFDFVGCDLNESYVNIACARIDTEAVTLKKKQTKKAQAKTEAKPQEAPLNYLTSFDQIEI
jgi:hypothetical protein